MVEQQDGIPTPWHLVHLGARAQGGFGLILTEATAVTPDGRISPQDTGLWNDEQADAWRPIVDFVHSQNSTIGVQLAHAGRKASSYRSFPGEPQGGSVPSSEGGWSTISPTQQAFTGLDVPRMLDTAEIADLVTAFAAAAVRADDAGFDVVEIHAAHGYLIHQFLSPLSNDRSDAYGGDFDGRTKFLLEIIDAVRAVWPADKPVFVRLSATDWAPGGWDGDQTVRLSSLLRDHGVDLVDVSTGGAVITEIPVEPGYQVPFAARVRQEAGVASGAVGMILSPSQAERILTDGNADTILLGRPALREPAWPLRAAAELGLTSSDSPYPPAHLSGRWDHQRAS